MIGLEGTAIPVTNCKDFHLLPPISTSLSNLPNEMLLMILKLLEKDQLKSVRCTCKLLENLVSPFLFDKIIISPHRENLDVFRQIAEHSYLCQYPRKLVYDLSHFPDNIDPAEYLTQLCWQLRFISKDQPCSSIYHADKDIERFIRAICGIPREDADFSNCRFVQRGLEIFREKAEEEDYYYNSGQLLACLCVGLTKLPYVDKVHLQYSWSYDHLKHVNWSKSTQDLHFFSSPLARAWSLFCLKPQMKHASISHEFDTVISAFSITKKPLRELGDIPGVSYKNFYSGSHLSRTFREHGRAAMYHLESLTLKFHVGHHLADADGKIVSVDLLADALLHMPGLRRLSLYNVMQVDGSGVMSLKELFQAVRLPALNYLWLRGMLGSAAEILSFLRASQQFRELGFEDIELSDGTWADLVDDMRRWLLLDSLTLAPFLCQDGGVDLADIDSRFAEFRSEHIIEEYVLHGGKNPLRVQG